MILEPTEVERSFSPVNMCFSGKKEGVSSSHRDG